MKVVRVDPDKEGEAEVVHELWPAVPRAHVLVQVYTASLDPDYEHAKARLAGALASGGGIQASDAGSGKRVGQDAMSRPGIFFAGVVTQLDPACTREDLQEGKPVVGICGALDVCGALAEYIAIPEYSVVCKPEEVSFEQAVAILPGAFVAYLALQLQRRTEAGDTILMPGGARAKAHVALQLAHRWGAKVACTAHTLQEALYLQSMASHCTLFDLSDSPQGLAFHTEEFTGGAGFDAVVQCDTSGPGVTDIDAINALGALGSWAVPCAKPQLDAALHGALQNKGATIAHVNPIAAISSGTMQGRILHILTDALALAKEGAVHANVSKELSLREAAAVMASSASLPPLGIAVVRIAAQQKNDD